MCGCATNLVLRAAGPYLFILSRWQGPVNHCELGAPDHGANLRARWAVGPTREEINLTFSPLDLNFTFNHVLLFYSFHHKSIRRTCFIVTAQLPIESDSHNITLCFETNSVPFGPLNCMIWYLCNSLRIFGLVWPTRLVFLTMEEMLSFWFNLAVSFSSDSRGSKARIVLLPSRIKRWGFHHIAWVNSSTSCHLT